MLQCKIFAVVHILGFCLNIWGYCKTPTYSGKSCTRDTIAKILNNTESNLDKILDKRKDHVDNLDSMAQLEVIPTPAKIEEELEQNLAVIKVCDYSTGSVKWLYGTKNCKVVNLFTAQYLVITLFSSEGSTVKAYTLMHVL